MLHFFARRMKEAREDERGFTLIELLVVVIIIGILAAIAIPTFLAQRDKARTALVQSDARTAGTAISICITDKSVDLCDTAAELDTYGYKPASKATQAFSQVGGPPATGVQIVSKHKDDTAITATFNSTTGNLS